MQNKNKDKLKRSLLALIEIALTLSILFFLSYLCFSFVAEIGNFLLRLVNAVAPTLLTLLIIRIVPSRFVVGKWSLYTITVALGVMIALILMLPLGPHSDKARYLDGRRLAAVRQLASALELYNNDTNTYPDSLEQLVPNYIGKQMNDYPITSSRKCKETGSQYLYHKISSAQFELKFCMEEGTGGYEKGVRTLTENGIQ